MGRGLAPTTLSIRRCVHAEGWRARIAPADAGIGRPTSTLALLFATRQVLCPTRHALTIRQRQPDHDAVGDGLPRFFRERRRDRRNP
jgi:homogentisate 1,2-dioxygenase